MKTSPKPKTKPNIINYITYGDAIIGYVVASSFKLHQGIALNSSPIVVLVVNKN